MKITKPGLYQLTEEYQGIPKGCYIRITKVYRNGLVSCTLFTDGTSGNMPVKLIKEFKDEE